MSQCYCVRCNNGVCDVCRGDPTVQTPEQREQELRAAGWTHRKPNGMLRQPGFWRSPDNLIFQDAELAYEAMRAERGEQLTMLEPQAHTYARSRFATIHRWPCRRKPRRRAEGSAASERRHSALAAHHLARCGPSPSYSIRSGLRPRTAARWRQCAEPDGGRVQPIQFGAEF